MGPFVSPILSLLCWPILFGVNAGVIFFWGSVSQVLPLERLVGALLFAYTGAKDAKFCSLASRAYIGSSVLSSWLLTTASLGSFMNKRLQFQLEIAPGFFGCSKIATSHKHAYSSEVLRSRDSGNLRTSELFNCAGLAFHNRQRSPRAAHC